MNLTSLLPQLLKATVIMAVAFATFPQAAKAIPASPKPIKVTQPDGSMTEVRLYGDEHRWIMTTADGSRIVSRDSDGLYQASEAFDPAEFSRKLTKARHKSSGAHLGGSGFPAHGQQKALAILVEYPKTDLHPEGREFTIANPRQHFADLLNKEGYDTDGSTGSVRDYFLNASSGVLDLKFDVFGPIVLSEDLSYYTKKTNGENLNAWRMVEEACRALDRQIDFTEYDRDNDGIIDNVYLFYAGEGGATSAYPDDCIWQHAADIENITGKQFIFDGRRLNHYACSNEYRIITDASGNSRKIAEGIGTVCHEFSHVLGLPDLYDTSGMGIYTPGVWAIMDTGCHLNDSRTPPHYTALERMMLGWIDPVVIEKKPQTLTLRDIDHNEAYRIDTPNDNEYFILENRQQSGQDTYLPGHGLLVWHIKYVEDYWKANQVNTRVNDMGVDIVRADGIKSDNSRDGDTFPGASKVSVLGDDGFPNMLTSNSLRTETPLSRITEAGGLISFDVCKTVSQLDKVTGLKATDIVPDGFTASWDEVNNAAGYRLNVYTMSGATMIPVGMYNDLNVSSSSVRVNGLEPATDYLFTVRAVSGAISGAESDECHVTTPAMTFAYSTPAGVTVTDVAATSFTVTWDALDDAADYSLTVFTKESGQSESTGVDFTDGVDMLPGGWVTNSNFTISMNGYYGNASPSLSLPDDYGRLQSPLLPNALIGLSFWYRERSGSGDGHIEIGVLTDDGWIEADRIELPSGMSEGIAYRMNSEMIPENAMAIRIVYRRGNRGSLAIDDVIAEYAGPAVNMPLPDWDDRNLGSTATTASVSDLTAGHDYYVTVRGIDASGMRSRPSDEVRVTAGSAIGNINGTKPTISVDSDGRIIVEGADSADLTIYDLQGRKIGQRLPSHGIYILKYREITAKIIF